MSRDGTVLTSVAAGDPAAARETYLRGIDVAAAKGDLATANKMQERLIFLDQGEGTG